MYWNNLQKIIFRFGCCYIFLFTMSNQFLLSFAIEPIWQKIAPWFAATFLNLEKEITVFTNGSGDTTYNYVCLLLYILLSIIITVVWSILDRRRKNYNYLLQWLLVLVRYYILYQMIIYGLAKLFYLQFQPPSHARLVQAYGDSSPMGILWTFMGQSKGYTIFAGAGELISGLLLISRRTTTLGALVAAGVMANVMAMNFFYDVPVKILSSHLVLLSLFLLALDGKRLLNLFFFNKNAEPKIYPPYFENIKLEKIKITIKWLLVIVGLGYTVNGTLESSKIYGPAAPKPALHGLYEVETFERNGDTIPPLITDETRWKRFIVDWKDRAEIHAMTGQKQYYSFEKDSVDSFIKVTHHRDTAMNDTLYFFEPDSAQFVLEGIFKGDTLKVSFLKKKKEDFLLRNRHFRWINEYPFNR
ncbi:MAG: hypothetical protein AAFZ15_08385 [Bacteroidota bacterium]